MTFELKRSVVASATTTDAPAALALRIIPPRFPGFSIDSTTSTRASSIGMADSGASHCRSTATNPLGLPRNEIFSSTGAVTDVIGIDRSSTTLSYTRAPCSVSRSSQT